MTYHVVLCDDEPNQLKALKGLLERVSFELDASLTTTAFALPSKLTTYLETHPDVASQTDLFLLDVEMPGIDGITLARTIRHRLPNASIVFITGYREYAADAYELEAFNYIMKPVTYERFAKVITEALRKRHQQTQVQDSPCVTIEKKEGSLRVPYSDILYFEKTLRKIRLITTDSAHEFYGSFKDLRNQLDMGQFVQCHQSFIVNISKVEGYSQQVLSLRASKDQLPVSKGLVKPVKTAMAKHLFEGGIRL